MFWPLWSLFPAAAAYAYWLRRRCGCDVGPGWQQMTLVVAVLLVLVTDVPFVALLVVVPPHLIGLQIGLIRALTAAIGGGLSVRFTAGRVCKW